MNFLDKKRILLGVTGGIACYKAVELVRLLVKAGAIVKVVMTEDATRFITPLTFQAITSKTAALSIWNDQTPNAMPHIDLSREADLILIAPASADFIAQLAGGFAGNLLSLLCLARPRSRVPLLIAPAMNKEMWWHPALKRNVEQVAADGAMILNVGCGEQACGEVGEGRMLEPYELLQEVTASLTPKDLYGKKILITAGPTWEAIDPIRGITNLSSGKMGFSLAEVAAQMGADVTLISGSHVTLGTPYRVLRINVISAKEMLDVSLQEAEKADIFIATAAVADWTVENTADKKIKKNKEGVIPEFKLKETVDILSTLAKSEKAKSKKLFCVGFSAESHDILKNSQKKRLKKSVPILIANNGPQTFGKDENTVIIIADDGVIQLPLLSKIELSHIILRQVAAKVN